MAARQEARRHEGRRCYPLRRKSRETAHQSLGRRAGHLPWEGGPHFSLQLGDLSPVAKAGTVRGMWQGRSGGQRKKEISWVQKQVD